GHSYGSTVAGMAATAGMEADRVVLAGSPGTGARNVAELNMKPESVYVARVPDDPIRHVFKSGEARNYLVGGPVGLLAGKAVGYDPDVHGPDPSLPEFGATPLPYDDKSHGHSAYYKEGSLSMRNHARLMVSLPPATQASGSGP
ncbi:MAG: alpha/beta hydrolase, partial [Egibacteraceae bacterium]